MDLYVTWLTLLTVNDVKSQQIPLKGAVNVRLERSVPVEPQPMCTAQPGNGIALYGYLLRPCLLRSSWGSGAARQKLGRRCRSASRSAHSFGQLALLDADRFRSPIRITSDTTLTRNLSSH